VGDSHCSQPHYERGPGAADPSNLLPDMNRPATRYTEPDDREFFAVYAR
jgi:hypothetical protein